MRRELTTRSTALYTGQGAFDRLLDIVGEEEGLAGGPAVQLDCFAIINNLLKGAQPVLAHPPDSDWMLLDLGNPSNQTLFRESNGMIRLGA